jgi:hypothetical protein
MPKSIAKYVWPSPNISMQLYIPNVIVVTEGSVIKIRIITDI